MRIFYAAIILGCVLACASCSRALESVCGSMSMTETEAIEVAKIRLERFAAREGIESIAFSEPQAYKQDDLLWVIDYKTDKSNLSSAYFFRVIIDNCGLVETSFSHDNSKDETEVEP